MYGVKGKILAFKAPGITERLSDLWARERERDPKMTQQDFADRAGVRQQLFSRWLKGQMPDYKNLRKLADAFGVSWVWILVGEAANVTEGQRPKSPEVAPAATKGQEVLRRRKRKRHQKKAS